MEFIALAAQDMDAAVGTLDGAAVTQFFAQAGDANLDGGLARAFGAAADDLGELPVVQPLAGSAEKAVSRASSMGCNATWPLRPCRLELAVSILPLLGNGVGLRRRAMEATAASRVSGLGAWPGRCRRR